MKDIRNTKQREEVLNAVKTLCNHPRAEDVYNCVIDNNHNISKGTVYKNLNLLSELDEISKIQMPGNEPDRFDVRIDEHHHAYCRVCKKLFDIDLDDSLKVNCHLQRMNFLVEKSQLFLTGICKECYEKEKENGIKGK